MVSAYLIEKGTGYGSSIINFNKNPIVTIKTGKNAEFMPIISNGKINQVKVTYAGLEYTSAPDLTFIGVGSGIGVGSTIGSGVGSGSWYMVPCCSDV